MEENDQNGDDKKIVQPIPRHDFGKRWYHFRLLTPRSAILRGSYAMNNLRFKPRSRGNQGAPCCVVAIVFGRLFEPKDWTKHFIDQVLEYGDKLFCISQTRNRVNAGVYMTVNLIYPEFFIGDYKCTICAEEGIVYGNLFSESIGCPDFTDGLQRFFKTCDAGVVTTQGISVGIWQQPEVGFFYFDPSPRSDDGTRCPDGVACLMRFKCMNELRELFLSNMDKRFDSRYCIARVSVLRVSPVNRGALQRDHRMAEKVDITKRPELVVDRKALRAINPLDVEDGKFNCTKAPPKELKIAALADVKIPKEPISITISNYKIDAQFATKPLIDRNSFDTGYEYYDMHVNIPSTFKELPGDMAILHGWTHEGSEMYKGKGAQNVANCVMAIGMKKVHAAKTWLRPKLDEILVLGDIIYAKVKADKPTIKSMTAADLNDTKFKIEDRKLIFDVDLITIVGTISSKIPSVLNLKQALEEFFIVNTDGVIECTSMAVAVWARNDYYYTFDPRQCGPLGVRIIEEKGKTGKGGKGAKVAAESNKKKQIKGKCCAIRFPNFDSLVALFLKNIDPSKKNDRFTIRHITVIEDIAGTRPWNDFAAAEMGKWILRGSITNDDDSFEDGSRGMQGPAIPIVALVNAKQTPPEKLTKEIIDETIRDGDAYFNWCNQNINDEEEKEVPFFMTDVRKDFYIKNRKIKIDYEDCTVVGVIKALPESEQLDLLNGIAKFFDSHELGVLQVDNLFVAIWKFEEELKDKTKENAYYCFDPNPRGKFGQTNPVGEDADEPVACILRTLELPVLARIIEDNVNPYSTGYSNEFMIHDVKVQSIGLPMSDEELEKDKQTPIKPDLNLFTAVGDDAACLSGSFNQSNEIMFRNKTRDKQQAATALVTLAMTKLYSPHLWYREVIDEVLKIGDKVATDSADNLPEAEEDEENKRDYLLVDEVNEDFNIGVNHMTVELDAEAASGKVSEMERVLEGFFEENTHGVLTQQKIIIPIWKEGNVYFMLDPMGRDSHGMPGEKDVTAVVMWFMNIPALANSIQMSIGKPDGEFTVDNVTIGNVYETRVAEGERPSRRTSTDELWYSFPKLSDGVWGISGKVSIGDDKFAEENRNKQSAAVAVMSVVFSKVYEPRSWKAEVLDEVIITGDKLHSKCTARLGGQIPRVNETITEFFLSNRRIDLTIKDCVQAGDLTGKPPKMQDLQTGIDLFFENYTSGTMALCNTHVAIWKFHNFYYCVISGSSASSESSTTPQILRFANTKLLVQHLLSHLCNGGDYEITAIDVVDWDKLPPWKFDPSPGICPSNLPPLNAFQRLQGARAILRGTTHQASDIFPDVVRNKQTAANCVIALGMSVIKSPITWTKKTLDEILVIGNNVHKETKKAAPTKEKIKPKDIIRVFYVGNNILTADIEENTISGQVAIPPPEPEVKGKGKKGKEKKKAGNKDKSKKGKKSRQKRVPLPPPPPILLEEGLRKFFEDNRAGILVTGRFMSAIWKDLGIYFMYDPRARCDRGLVDDLGASCLMWFACVEPLYDMLLTNIDEGEKFGPFKIGRVVIRTNLIESLPCPAGFRLVQQSTAPPIPVSAVKKVTTLDVETLSEYIFIDEEMSIIRGNMHLNDHRFCIKSRGLQSTAIAAVAIVVGLLHVPSTWTAELIDAIMKYGDLLHNDSTRVARPGARNLSPSELLTVFVVGDFRANIHIHHHTVAGILYPYDLSEQLALFFKNNCSGILHLPNVAVAVMQHYGKFYLFDPQPRDEFGRANFDGAACVMKCESIAKMAQMFVLNCNYKMPTVYTLNAVNVLRLHFFSDAKNECPPPCLK